jgi:spore germination protein YaaH
MAFDFSNTNNSADADHIDHDADYIKIVAVGWYHINANGVVSAAPNQRVLEIADTNNIPIFPTIQIPNMNAQVGHDAITTYKSSVISQLVSLATPQNVGGIDLDIEGILACDRQNYTDFVDDLAQALHNNGKKLILSVPAKLFDDMNSNWSGAFDYHDLSNLADALQIMTYDEHGQDGADAGPVAGLNWIKLCLNYTLKVVPASKIYMGIPAYGYDWNTSANTVTPLINWDDIPSLLSQNGATSYWDSPSSSPYANYTDSSNQLHKLWYENGSSIRAKAGLASSLNLGGIAIFSIEKDDAKLWPAIIAGINQTAVSISSVNYLLMY